MDELKVFGEECEGAVVTPTSPLPRKASRRSSMATARRMSRASGMGIGIPLSDLLSTIPRPEEASIQERLEKMVNLVVNSTIRQVEGGVEDEVGGLEEAVKEVGSSLRREKVSEDVLRSAASKLEGGLNVVEGEVIGEAKRKVLANIENHKQEYKRWKNLILERKEQNNRAASIAKDASEGRLKIEAGQRFQLSKEERDALDQMPDGTKTMEKLAKHRTLMLVKAQAASTAARRLKRKVEEEEEELAELAVKIIERADQAGGKLEKLNPEDLLED